MSSDDRSSNAADTLPGRSVVPGSIPRSEWYTVGAVLVFAAVLRFAAPGRLAVEHFDEGVYASNLWFGEEQGFGYPDRFLYAPPLVPAAIEWSLILLGPGGWVPMLPGMLFGAATIVGVWWLGRQWYGGTVGCVAAFLVACSEYDILYSRTALVDAPMTCFLVFALACAWRGMARRDLRWIALGGALAGLAWWTKYNGWLAAAVVVAGTVATVIERGVRAGPRGRRFPGLRHSAPDVAAAGGGETVWELKAAAVLVVVCAFVWSPVWWSLQSVGGYGRVAENHRRYWLATADAPAERATAMSSLLAVWGANARRQLRVQRHLEGLPSWLALVVAMAGLAGWIRRAPRNCPTLRYADALQAAETVGDTTPAPGDDRSGDGFLRVRRVVAAAVTAGAVAVAALAASSGVTAVCWALAAGGLVAAGTRPWLVTPDDIAADVALRRRAFWWHAAWWMGLVIATPCYYPYPRIAMPLMIATRIAAAAGIVLLIRLAVHGAVLAVGPRLSDGDVSASWTSPWRAMVTVKIAMVAVFAVVVAATAGASSRPAGSVRAWPVRTGLRDAVRAAEATITAEVTRQRGSAAHWAAYVFAVPAAVYHLSADGFVAQPTADLRFMDDREHLRRAAIFLITGEQTERLAEWRDADMQRRRRLERVTEIPYRASDVVVLDDTPPEQAERHRMRVLRVWRVRP